MKVDLTIRSLVIAILLLSFTAARAQDAKLTLKNIYSNNTFAQKGFGPVRWMKDSRGYSSVEGNEITRYNAETGEKSVLVSAKQLTPTGANAPLGIDDYVWSDDNAKLLI